MLIINFACNTLVFVTFESTCQLTNELMNIRKLMNDEGLLYGLVPEKMPQGLSREFEVIIILVKSLPYSKT